MEININKVIGSHNNDVHEMTQMKKKVKAIDKRKHVGIKSDGDTKNESLNKDKVHLNNNNKSESPVITKDTSAVSTSSNKTQTDISKDSSLAEVKAQDTDESIGKSQLLKHQVNIANNNDEANNKESKRSRKISFFNTDSNSKRKLSLAFDNVDGDSTLLTNLSKGRRKTMRKLLVGADKCRRSGHLPQDSLKSNTTSGGDQQTSITKHDREKMMKYLWKDLKSGNIQSLTSILEYDIVNLKEIDPQGSLLSYATSNYNVQAVEALLNHGSPIEPDEKSGGLSPIHLAIKAGNTAFIDIFLSHNIPLDIPTMYEKKTSLHIAVKYGHMDVAEMLINTHKADPNEQDIYGCSPLHTAVISGKSKFVTFLLSKNADINLTDNEGWTPLHTAVVSSSPPIVKLLLNNKAHTNAQTKYGKTPLHLACKCNNLSAVTLLLDNEACTEVRDCHGKIAVEYTTHRDINTIAKNASYTRCSEQSDDTPAKHIHMKVRSKSLIDYLDKEYLNDHYFTSDDVDEPVMKGCASYNDLIRIQNSSIIEEETRIPNIVITHPTPEKVTDLTTIEEDKPLKRQTSPFQSIAKIIVGLKRSAKSTANRPKDEVPDHVNNNNKNESHQNFTRCDSIESQDSTILQTSITLPYGTMNTIMEQSTDGSDAASTDNESHIDKSKDFKVTMANVDDETVNIDIEVISNTSDDYSKESVDITVGDTEFVQNKRSTSLDEPIPVIKNKIITDTIDNERFYKSKSDLSNISSMDTTSVNSDVMSNFGALTLNKDHLNGYDQNQSMSDGSSDDSLEQDYLKRYEVQHNKTNQVDSVIYTHVDSCIASIANISTSIDDLKDVEHLGKREQKLEELKDYLKNWMDNTLVIKQKLEHKLDSNSTR